MREVFQAFLVNLLEITLLVLLEQLLLGVLRVEVPLDYLDFLESGRLLLVYAGPPGSVC